MGRLQMQDLMLKSSSSSSYLFASKHNKHKHTRKQRQAATCKVQRIEGIYPWLHWLLS